MPTENQETKHYRFFQNKECEYFPCHETTDPENFNCLFCYCPLYVLGTDCGGNCEIKENGVKSCINCLFPHKRENYDRINARFSDLLQKMNGEK